MECGIQIIILKHVSTLRLLNLLNLNNRIFELKIELIPL